MVSEETRGKVSPTGLQLKRRSVRRRGKNTNRNGRGRVDLKGSDQRPYKKGHDADALNKGEAKDLLLPERI